MNTCIRRLAIVFTAGILGVASRSAAAADVASSPIAHWKLTADANDSAAGPLPTHNHGVTFTAPGPDGKTPAAVFDGRSTFLEVKPHDRLRLGTGDFTLALWVHTDASHDGGPGDLLTLYDESKRTGFHLCLRTNPGATGTANTRQLQFGIDAQSQPRWIDEGRPGSAILAFALAVHAGHLYAGTAHNASGQAGHVYQYDQAGKWTDCGTPDRCNAVTALTTYQGKLYAGTGKYRFSGSALQESDNTNLGGGVYRYEGGTRWTEVGRLPNVEAIACLTPFRGRLYASSLYKPAGFFRYESDGRWTTLPVPDGKRVESLAVFHDALWAGSYDGAHVYRYDGNQWKDVGQFAGDTQTYAFTVHHGRLCVGNWPSGKVFRLAADHWEDLGQLGHEREVMGMLVHNGQLYGGSLPLGAVYRYDQGQTWTQTAQLDTTPDVKYRRAWTMAAFDGRLFCSTLPSGRIHSLVAGASTTYDHELPSGWQHVTAVKRGGVLQLYHNGKPVAQSQRFDPALFNVNTETPLRIGAGTGGFFHGALADVRLYSRALREAEIQALASR